MPDRRGDGPDVRDVLRKILARPELAEAIGRVGRRPVERFRWLTGFAATDVGIHRDMVPEEVVLPADTPEHLTPPGVDLDALRLEVIAFADTAPGASVRLPMKGLPYVRRRGAVPSLFDADPAPAISELHGDVSSALRCLAETGLLPLPMRVTGYRWDRATGVLAPATSIDPDEDTEVKSWVFGAVVQLLAEVAPKMRTCRNPACRRRLFLWETRRQVYCGGLCSAQVRAERYRAAHPDRVSVTKHEGYKRRRQKQLGKKVKVQRRPRSVASARRR